MSEQRSVPNGRTLLAGKVISNFGQSSIDCVVRQISDHRATISVESPLGIPLHFHLLILDERIPRPCKRVWQSDREVGLEFESTEAAPESRPLQIEAPERRTESVIRGQMLALRSALDEIQIGVVLLDRELRAQFINRAFRQMWKLPDAVADSKPAFIVLMYHGRDTHAYEEQPDTDAYIAERVRLIQAGATAALDLRRSNGDVIRLQCAVLPNGGRMLSYTMVTDIVRHSDELEVLRAALDNVPDGVLLLDSELRAQFLNRKVREYWGVTEQHAADHPSYAELIAASPHAGAHGVPPDQLDAFFASRVEAIRRAEPKVRDTRLADGRHVRIHCIVTPNGGRMLTYCDVTDLVRNAEMLERLATVDSMTGLYNRRHFLELAAAEWSRFARYQRPLSVLMVDIDFFKSVNDRYGHAVGDEAIVSVARACQHGKRSSDILGRLGGEEFAVLLPETDAAQAAIVAERIRADVASQVLFAYKVQFGITISIGIAAATASMSGMEALLREADQALYQAKADGRNRIAHRPDPATPRLAAE